MSEDIELRVKAFVAKQTGTKPEGINSKTTLFGDLGVDGADGWELIEAFGREFHVDLATFDASKHFGPEAGAFLPLFFIQVFRRLILKEDSHKIGGVDPITIGDLVTTARAKRWLL